MTDAKTRRGPAELAGDAADQEALLAEMSSAVYGYLRVRLDNRHDAEDLTQEVLYRWVSGRATRPADAPLRYWLVGVARNVLLEHLRRGRRRPETAWTEMCLAVEEAAAPGQNEHPLADQLPNCMQTLGPNAKKALELRYAAQLRMAEIGARMRRSEGAVKVLVCRARAALRRCLLGRPGEGCGDD